MSQREKMRGLNWSISPQERRRWEWERKIEIIKLNHVRFSCNYLLLPRYDWTKSPPAISSNTPICVLILWMAIRAQNKIIGIQIGKGKRKGQAWFWLHGLLTMTHISEPWLCWCEWLKDTIWKLKQSYTVLLLCFVLQWLYAIVWIYYNGEISLVILLVT